MDNAHKIHPYLIISAFPLTCNDCINMIHRKCGFSPHYVGSQLPETKSKSIYLNKSLDRQVPKDTDACLTKENNTQ